MGPADPAPEQGRTMTLEAYADTIIPGEKRHPGDHAIAGAATGGGAVAAGAVELLEHPAGGLADSLDGLMSLLNLHAMTCAAEQGLTLDPSLPAFVALPFEHRTALVQHLTAPDHPEKSLWVGLAMFSTMAFDSAAHISTPEAIRQGHPGLLTTGFERPEADGVWRFAQYSYGRRLSNPHPHTTATGSPR